MPVLDGDDAAVVGDAVVQALECGFAGGDIVLDRVARLACRNIQSRILADIQAYRRTDGESLWVGGDAHGQDARTHALHLLCAQATDIVRERSDSHSFGGKHAVRCYYPENLNRLLPGGSLGQRVRLRRRSL